MNSCQSWYKDEIMVTEKMKDIQREVNTFHLLQDAGLSRPGLYARAALAFGKLLVRFGENLQKKYSPGTQIYRPTNGKYAT